MRYLRLDIFVLLNQDYFTEVITLSNITNLTASSATLRVFKREFFLLKKVLKIC